MGRLLKHSFLEHFCLDQFSVIQDNLYIERFSRLEHLVWSNTSGLQFQGELTKWDKLNGTNRAEFVVFRRFSLIFADFRFFLGITAFRRCRFFAENRRKPQIFAETRLSHLVCPSLLIPPYNSSCSNKLFVSTLRPSHYFGRVARENPWTPEKTKKVVSSLPYRATRYVSGMGVLRRSKQGRRSLSMRDGSVFYI